MPFPEFIFTKLKGATRYCTELRYTEFYQNRQRRVEIASLSSFTPLSNIQTTHRSVPQNFRLLYNLKNLYRIQRKFNKRFSHWYRVKDAHV